MKKNIFFVSAFALLSIFSCIKHEVVPAPTPLVELEAHFTGLINGTDIEYTEDVDGYNGGSSFEQYITSSSSTADTTVYFMSMSSDIVTPSITIGIGGIAWDASSLSIPSLNQFTTFFTDLEDDGSGNPVIPYYKDAKAGYAVIYKDNDGHVWRSTLHHDGNVLENPPVPLESPTFTNMTIESDNSGDYAKFTTRFGCELYRFVEYIISDLPPFDTLSRNYDTIKILNGEFSGWIKR